jgi:hypothetical protein
MRQDAWWMHVHVRYWQSSQRLQVNALRQRLLCARWALQIRLHLTHCCVLFVVVLKVWHMVCKPRVPHGEGG